MAVELSSKLFINSQLYQAESSKLDLIRRLARFAKSSLLAFLSTLKPETAQRYQPTKYDSADCEWSADQQASKQHNTIQLSLALFYINILNSFSIPLAESAALLIDSPRLYRQVPARETFAGSPHVLILLSVSHSINTHVSRRHCRPNCWLCFYVLRTELLQSLFVFLVKNCGLDGGE